ncbi:DUF5017 domain-containing protein [Terrimonas ferruginea]|uniref:DUF5017 domain-containing protein n=1 Tax=Terrimonas ferruginea TaxID=249 RepID=UPI000427CF83|nr:DUF5017 domain-containing protein [Terrimonas ferruginea]
MVKAITTNITTGIILLITVLAQTGCSKKIEVNGGEPDLKVSLPAITFKAGEPVTFQFKGDAGLISFFSGEVFHDYNFREGRVLEQGALKLSFNTAVQYGTQANQFSVQASSDFNGNYTAFSNVQQASWTDITNRFTIGTGTTYTLSGVKDITDLVQEGKPLYIAFKYIYRPSATYGTRRTWRVQNFNLSSTTASLGTQVIGNMTTSGFTTVEQNPLTEPSATTISASTISLVGTAVTPSTLTNETWVITKGFSTGKVDLGPDRPVAIKGIADAKLTSFSHIYEKPGTYKAYFIAANANIDDKKETVQSVDVIVEP